RRAGTCAGALRSDSQQAAIAPCERATTRADRVNVDERGEDGEAADFALGANRRGALDDQARLETGAAHVDTNQVAIARCREHPACDVAANRAREQGENAFVFRFARADETAVGLQQEQPRVAPLLQSAFQAREIL